MSKYDPRPEGADADKSIGIDPSATEEQPPAQSGQSADADRPARAKLSPEERERRRARKRKRRRKLLLLWLTFYAAAAVLIFCIVDIVFTVYQRKAARDQYAAIQRQYEISAPEGTPPPDGEALPEPTVDPSKWYAAYGMPADKRIDFDALRKRNPDVCAWITVEGTGIDFPLLRSDTSDDYYLSHDIDGKASEHGGISMDPRCERDFSSRVTMIYGHNMLDGSMFAPLYNFYKDPAFFEAEHRVRIYLDDAMLVYRVLSAYEYGHEQPLYYYNLLKEEEFLRYCDTFLKNRDLKARLVSDAEILPDDHVLTLITSTNARADKRLFVQAVLLRAA